MMGHQVGGPACCPSIFRASEQSVSAPSFRRGKRHLTDVVQCRIPWELPTIHERQVPLKSIVSRRGPVALARTRQCSVAFQVIVDATGGMDIKYE